MDLLKQFGTSKELEVNGVIFKLDDTTSFTLARASSLNTKYQTTLTNLMKPYKRQMQMGTLQDEIARDLLVRAFVKGCLLDWKGVCFGGKKLSFSEENALTLLKDLPDLFDILNEESQRMENFRQEEVEDSVKK